MMAVYGLTSIIATSWIAKSLAQKEFRIARTPLDIPILLFVASQFTSSLFSIDPHVSWLGYYSRFNGGMWSVISYVLLFYTFVSNAQLFSHSQASSDVSHVMYQASNKKKSKKYKNIQRDTLTPDILTPLFNIMLITASLVALYGVLERLGIDKHIWVQDVQNRVFSTLGQPNWLAAYLVALLPLTMAFGLRRFWWFIVSILFFIVLLFTRSRSGLLGFLVADVVFLGMLYTSLRSRMALGSLKENAIRIFLTLHVVLAIIVFIHGTGVEKIDQWFTFRGLLSKIEHRKSLDTTPPTITGPALEVGGTESGTIRKYVWQGAINAWNSSWKTRLIGTGTETFAFAFYQYRPVGHNNTSEWDFLYNKAHNEYLNYLATTGIFGLGSYLSLIGMFIYWFIKILSSLFIVHSKRTSLVMNHEPSTIVTLALFAGWVSILVTNFFGFSVVTQQLFLFLFPALIFVLQNNEVQKFQTHKVNTPPWMIWVAVIGGLFTLVRVGSFWYADTLYAKGYRLIRGGLLGQAIPALTRAIRINPGEPMYHDEIASGYATVAVAAYEEKNATQAAQLAALAIEENNKAISKSPRNVNFYKTRTKIYYTLTAIDPTFNAKAVEALEAAIHLSPNDPKIYYNLAILVGRDGASDQAIAYLRKAKELKSNYRDAYYALWVFFTEAKQMTAARSILEEYLTNVDPNDKDFLEKLK